MLLSAFGGNRPCYYWARSARGAIRNVNDIMPSADSVAIAACYAPLIPGLDAVWYSLVPVGDDVGPAS